MVESKLILLIKRSPLPDSLGANPPRSRELWTNRNFWQVLTTILVSLLLMFGSLPMPIKKVAIHSIPTGIIAVGTFFIVRIIESTIGAVIAIIFLSFVLSYIAWLLIKPHEEDERISNVLSEKVRSIRRRAMLNFMAARSEASSEMNS